MYSSHNLVLAQVFVCSFVCLCVFCFVCLFVFVFIENSIYKYYLYLFNTVAIRKTT